MYIYIMLHFKHPHFICILLFYRQTPTGWITNEEFRHCIFDKLLPNIRTKREKLKVRRALLLLDGHSTRLQQDIWEKLSEDEVDILCIQAHTSNITQSLDLCVNAQFKRLLSDTGPFPKKTEMEKKLKIFVSSVCDKIYLSLQPKFIRKGLC
jgi:hypothetical protein